MVKGNKKTLCPQGQQSPSTRQLISAQSRLPIILEIKIKLAIFAYFTIGLMYGLVHVNEKTEYPHRLTNHQQFDG